MGKFRKNTHGLHTKKKRRHTEGTRKKRFAHEGTRKVSHGSVMRLIFLAFLALVFVAVTSHYGGLGAASQKRRLLALCFARAHHGHEAEADFRAHVKKCQDRFRNKALLKLAIKNKKVSAVNPKIRGRRIGTAGIKRPFGNRKRPLTEKQREKYKRREEARLS